MGFSFSFKEDAIEKGKRSGRLIKVKGVVEMWYLSELFEEEPRQYGLRGDDHFWKYLKEYFSTVRFPYSEEWMTDDIYRLFLKVTGEQLSAECKPFVKEYDNGGMSSGVLSGKFWVEKGIPLLVERYHKRLKEIGLGVYSGHWVRIVDENDKVFEGFISDYFYADDNESGNESIVLENAHINLVEFEEKDIKKITVIKK